MTRNKYSSPGSVVGQLLPKIYTRRILLEDTKTDTTRVGITNQIGEDSISGFPVDRIDPQANQALFADDHLNALEDGMTPEDAAALARYEAFYQRLIQSEHTVLPLERAAPATSLTVDFNIKDVLTDGFIGILSQTEDRTLPERDSTRAHDLASNGMGANLSTGARLFTQHLSSQSNVRQTVLSALKIGLVVTSTPQAAEQVYTFLANSSLVAQGINQPPNDSSFALNLSTLMADLGGDGHPSFWVKMEGRPQSLGLEVANSIYQAHDANNNLVNVIPYRYQMFLSNAEYMNCADLSLFCFSYFDFKSLLIPGNDELMPEETLNKLGWFLGDITYDRVTRNNKVESRSLVYRDEKTGEPYVGPVHAMQDSPGVMSGLVHTPSSRRLVKTFIPRTKVQDLRKIERSKMVHFQPATITQVTMENPGLEPTSTLVENYLSKRNRNFFGIYDAYTEFKTTTGHAHINFQINMLDIYRNNSRFYPLIEALDTRSTLNLRHGDGLPGIEQYPNFVANYLGTTSNTGGNRTVDSSPYENYIGLEDWVTKKLDILTIQLIRRRLSSGRTSNNRLSVSRHTPYDETNEPKHVVATLNSTRNITTHRAAYPTVSDSVGMLKIYDVNLGKLSVQAEDKTAGSLSSTNGVYQYGVKLVLRDTTRDYFRLELQYCRSLLTELKDYLRNASIPVGDSHYINTSDDTIVIGLGGERTTGQVGDSKTYGNYDRRTRTFSREFVDRAIEAKLEEKLFNPIVDEYLSLVILSFAKAKFSGTPSKTTSLQTNEDLVDTLQSSDSLRSLNEENEWDRDTAKEMYLNMLKPQNATPETIQNFITACEEIVLSFENFFEFKYLGDGLDIEGAGYSASGGSKNIIEVERWLPENRYRRIDTEYMHDSSDLTKGTLGKRTQLFEVFNRDTTYLNFDKKEALAGANFTYPLDPIRVGRTQAGGLRTRVTAREDGSNFRTGTSEEGIDDYLFQQWLQQFKPTENAESYGRNAAQADRFGDFQQRGGWTGTNAPMVMLPQSLIIGSNTLEIFFHLEDLLKLYPTELGGKRIVPYRQSHHLNQRDVDGFSSQVGETVGEHIPRPLTDPIPILIQTPEERAIMDAFKRALASFQSRHDLAAAKIIMDDLSIHLRGWLAPTSVDSPAFADVQERTMRVLMNYTAGMNPGSIDAALAPGGAQHDYHAEQQFQIARNVNQPLVFPSKKIDVNDFNECGLYENTDSSNQPIQSLGEDFEESQSSAFYENVRRFYNVTDAVPSFNGPSGQIANVLNVLEDDAVGQSEILREGMVFVGITPRSGDGPTTLAKSHADIVRAKERGDLFSYIPVAEAMEAHEEYNNFLSNFAGSNYPTNAINGLAVSSIRIPPGENNFSLGIGNPGAASRQQVVAGLLSDQDFVTAQQRIQYGPGGVPFRPGW